MRNMMSYDFMETMRNMNQWLGATAQAYASNPAFAAFPNPALEWTAAWGQVAERSFMRMVVKPDWGIDSFTCEDGRDHTVQVDQIKTGAFGDLIHFNVRVFFILSH